MMKTMTKLGMLRIAALSTVASAILSAIVAFLFSFVVEVPDLRMHLKLSFIIPFFVTPLFSWMTAVALRESRQARIKAFQLARTDPLTGLLNRRAFFEANDNARKIREPSALRSILFIDIDHFKTINDTFGHEGGDKVLREFSTLLTNIVRKADLVARFGGEEFIIEAAEVTPDDAIAIANRILDEVRTHEAPFHGSTIPYSVSIGIAHGDYATPIDPLLATADAQLYLAKKSGRDCVRSDDAPTGHSVPPIVGMSGRRRAIKFA